MQTRINWHHSLFSLSAEDGRLILSSNSDIDISARQNLEFVASDIVLKAHTVSHCQYRLWFFHFFFFFVRFVCRTNIFILKNCDFLIARKVRSLVEVLNRILFASARTVLYSLLLIAVNMLSIVGNNNSNQNQFVNIFTSSSFFLSSVLIEFLLFFLNVVFRAKLR